MNITTWDYVKIWFVCGLLNFLGTVATTGLTIFIYEYCPRGRAVLEWFYKKAKGRREG